MLTTVTALAVDPAGSKLACHGYDSPLENEESLQEYLFVLDVTTGALASKIMHITN